MNVLYAYTYDEVRRMLRWEMMKSRDGLQLSNKEVDILIAAFTDDVLKMWERAGLSNKQDFQTRVDAYRRP